MTQFTTPSPYLFLSVAIVGTSPLHVVADYLVITCHSYHVIVMLHCKQCLCSGMRGWTLFLFMYSWYHASYPFMQNWSALLSKKSLHRAWRWFVRPICLDWVLQHSTQECRLKSTRVSNEYIALFCSLFINWIVGPTWYGNTTSTIHCIFIKLVSFFPFFDGVNILPLEGFT